MLSLYEQSLYLQGARDVLLRLKDNYDMYLIPSIKCRCKPSEYLPNVDKHYCWLPLNNTNTRKLVGKGLLNALVQDRECLNRFLQGNDELQVTGVTKDKKGKVIELEIKVNKD